MTEVIGFEHKAYFLGMGRAVIRVVTPIDVQDRC